ncbi:response regulator [uncultured Erythrobacter sp.]|uniref:response regulator n=1 Tax=uncultured Erythrobacter sp. TaxID=263913 RepID=UPI0026162815|nr:response regulator [uncultured Erythrobacter sp.]
MARPLIILVIDDDDRIVDTLVKMISCLGHEAVCVESTQMEAMIRAGSKPDVIMTDVFMPKVEGLSIIRMVQNSAFRDVPILAMSGGGKTLGGERDVSNSYFAKAAVDFGAAKFLAKPFSLGQLREAITECRALLSA